MSRAKKAPIPTTIPYPTPLDRTRIPLVVDMFIQLGMQWCNPVVKSKVQPPIALQNISLRHEYTWRTQYSVSQTNGEIDNR